MKSLRLAPAGQVDGSQPCSRCQQAEQRWDRIAGKTYCPNCQESLALGEAPPLLERTEKKRCSICNQEGTVCYHTFPLGAAHAVEMDLCPEHLRGLLGRRLGPHAYYQLCRQLTLLSLSPDQVFLLHEAFYDDMGRALQPANEVE